MHVQMLVEHVHSECCLTFTLSHHPYHVQMLVERATSECCLSFSTRPAQAQALAEHVLLGAWSHDRLRDALGWRAMLVRKE